MKMNVFELYSGIGGMHLALRESEVEGKILRAIDINTSANNVYRFNFPDTVLLERNVQSLTVEDFNDLNIEMILMSPPCQPYTRVGLKMDIEDNRNNSLLHLIKIFPKLTSLKYVLLENVLGFEESKARDQFVEALEESQFSYQEFLLSPSQFGIPNSRLRYYLIAKRKPLKFPFCISKKILRELPELTDETRLFLENVKVKKIGETGFPNSRIGSFIEDSSNMYLVPPEKLHRYCTIFDIVTEDSLNSCCFTKAYSHYVEGTGSVYTPLKRDKMDEIFREVMSEEKGSERYKYLLEQLRLRYFSPREVARLMCFPEHFNFPSNMTDKQMYRLLGNSINVTVVSILIRLLAS